MCVVDPAYPAIPCWARAAWNWEFRVLMAAAGAAQSAITALTSFEVSWRRAVQFGKESYWPG
ncbi:MAG TPA: hypothetical protein VGX23_26335 [Actinocrinis sp.]|nr:hypothetical protein [Actinocrinis sp.]